MEKIAWSRIVCRWCSTRLRYKFFIKTFFCSRCLQDKEKLDKTKSLDLPLIATNEWVSVNDVATGMGQGELRVLLAAGFEHQVHRLARALDLKPQMKEAAVDSFQLESPINQSFEEEEQRKPANRSFDDYDSVADSEDEEPLEFGLIRLEVNVEQGRNLPRIKTSEGKFFPNTYVTLPPTYNSNKLVNGRPPKSSPPSSVIISNDCHPKWNLTHVLNCSTALLCDPRRHLIVKVWHKPENGPSVDDHVLGFAAIDLTPLLKEFPSICGWYNVIDFVGRVRGQIKVEIKPVQSEANLDILKTLKQRKVSTDTDEIDVETEPKLSVEEEEEKEEPRQLQQQPCHWTLPESSTSTNNGDTQSFLAAKLSDLEDLSNQLRKKLEMTDDVDVSPPSPERNVEECTLSQIQATINSQLTAMKTQLRQDALDHLQDAEELPDLGDIDWDEVIGDDRMEPDGGNPSITSDSPGTWRRKPVHYLGLKYKIDQK